MGTKIEWTDETLNPVVGCTKCSPGCKNCYAERMARRLQAMGLPQYENVVDPDGYWTGEIGLNMAVLDKIKTWRKPRRVFMVSMGDLFHSNVPFPVISEIAEIMMNAPQHTFQLLTKRPERMLEWFVWSGFSYKTLPNVWVGVTAENQEQADKRIPLLLQIPATARFVSVEPMLGPVDLSEWDQPPEYCCDGHDCGCRGLPIYPPPYHALDWVICGGETGPGARPMHPDWVRSLRNQCQHADVPFFFKSWGDWCPGELCESGTHYRYQNEYWPDWNKHRGVATVRTHEDGVKFIHVGKKAAGNILDGHKFNEYPDVK